MTKIYLYYFILSKLAFEKPNNTALAYAEATQVTPDTGIVEC
jgi:hypothetical protein